MTEIPRTLFTTDPVFKQLFELIKSRHKVARHTERTLRRNRNIKDYCEEARCFAEISGKTHIYLHYDVSSWWKEPNGVQVRINSIGIYDTYMEWDIARLRQLHGAKNADIPGSN